jgi:hypothetical protein
MFFNGRQKPLKNNLTVFDGMESWQISMPDCHQIWQNSCIAIANNLEEYDAREW